MSMQLKKTEQALHNNNYADYYSDSCHKILDFQRALTRHSEADTLRQQRLCNQKIIRQVISEQDINALIAIQKTISAAASAQVYIICELIVPAQNFSLSPAQHLALLSIFSQTDLLICTRALYQQIMQMPAGNASSAALALTTAQRELLLKDPHSDLWSYSGTATPAEFSFCQPSPWHDATTGALSAVTATFMLFGKRSCDALVLGLSYLQQNLRHSQSNRLDFTSDQQKKHPEAYCWPVQLCDFPRLKSDICTARLKPFVKTDTLSLGLYPVVDSLQWLEKLLELGVKTIQLRIKDLGGAALDTLVGAAAALGRRYAARLFINDYWQLAIKHQCYGVHLGQEDIGQANLIAIQQAGLRLGISTHSEFEWLRATAIHPSYIAMGTVYTTQTKPAILIGLSNLKNWCRTLAGHFPIVAIGGIKLDNIDAVLATGAGSIALVTAITAAEDYRAATISLQGKLSDALTLQ